MSNYRVTVDQWESDEVGDYGIINIYGVDGSTVATEIFNESDEVAGMVKFLLGCGTVHLRRLPFNPYGDGVEYVATVDPA